MKSPLSERPIFHHTERRTESHIFLCVLAYHLLIAIEKTLLDHGIHTSWPTVRDTLKAHQVCTIVLPTNNGSILRIRKAATPEPDVHEIYRHLAVSPNIIKPQHTWSIPIVTNKRPISLRQNNFVLQNVEVGLAPTHTEHVWEFTWLMPQT
jgi:hypothetical protein